MLNPFEGKGLFKKIESRRCHADIKKIIQYFGNRAKECGSSDRKCQPIKFDKYLISKTELKHNNYNGKSPHDKCYNNKENDKYKEDIDYKRIMDYMLFGGKEYRYENPSRFGRFFSIILWSKDIQASPISIFNFVMNLPYLVFNFDKVKNNRVATASSNSKIMKKLDVHLIPIFLGPHNVSDISSVMNKYYNKYHKASDCFDEEMLQMLKSLYSVEYEETCTILELQSQNYFKDILKYICTFVNYTSNSDLSIQSNSHKHLHLRDIIPDVLENESYLIEPDLVIFDKENVARIIIEMKRAPMFKGFKVPEIGDMITPFRNNENGDPLIKDKISRFHKMLDQLLVNMLGYDCPRGILSDGYTVILVEVEISKLSKQCKKIHINEIPLTMTTFDCRSSDPSYLQWLLAYLMKATLDPISFDPNKLLRFEVMQDTKYSLTEGDKYVDDKGNIHKKNTNIKPDHQYFTHQPLIISLDDQLSMTRNDPLHYLLVKIKAKKVKALILENINDEETVNVKFFDIKLLKDKIIREVYDQESELAQRLTNLNANTLYLKQTKKELSYFKEDGPIKGNFIASRYLESNQLPMNKEIVAMAFQQLKFIHEAGLLHGDIRVANILFDDGNKKVYIIGCKNTGTKEKDISDLKKIFKCKS